MELLATIALWAGLAFLMMRFGCGAHGTGHGRHNGGTPVEAGPGRTSSQRWTPPEKAIDPVCGETVRTANAKASLHEGHAYYFCSRDCREIFEAAPELYLAGDEPRPRQTEHSHA